jgi:hypothetical protein
MKDIMDILNDPAMVDVAVKEDAKRAKRREQYRKHKEASIIKESDNSIAGLPPLERIAIIIARAKKQH